MSRIICLILITPHSGHARRDGLLYLMVKKLRSFTLKSTATTCCPVVELMMKIYLPGWHAKYVKSWAARSRLPVKLAAQSSTWTGGQRNKLTIVTRPRKLALPWIDLPLILKPKRAMKLSGQITWPKLFSWLKQRLPRIETAN